MSIDTLPEETGKDFINLESGTYLGICYRVLDLGTQSRVWNGETQEQHKVLIGWELPEELMPADRETGEIRPFTINNRYTWSMSQKANLRHDLENWRGVPFDKADLGQNGFQIKKLLGVPCILTIVKETKESGKTYSNVKGIGPIMKGMKDRVPALKNKPQYLDLDHTKFDRALFESLSDGLKKVIAASPEYQSIFSGPKAERNGYGAQSRGDEHHPTSRTGSFGNHNHNRGRALDDEIPF